MWNPTCSGVAEKLLQGTNSRRHTGELVKPRMGTKIRSGSPNSPPPSMDQSQLMQKFGETSNTRIFLRSSKTSCGRSSTIHTDAQSVKDTKPTKNMRKIIRMRRVRPRTQYSPLRHEIETPTSRTMEPHQQRREQHTPTKEPADRTPIYTHEVERSSLDDVLRCWAWTRGLR